MLAAAMEKACFDISNAHHYEVQLPKSFHSDSVISVFSYTSRFFLFLVALFDCYST